ncbi:MAG: hypothetical protein JNL09_05995 [Anaerolineales bacterium]|nr:hypothetical protein [Anaerolineales bacterium]
MLLLRPDFFLWGVVSLLAVAALWIANVLGYFDIIWLALGITVIVAATFWRWGRYFLIYMTVDPTANNGNGRVTVERIIPAPNLPEQAEMSLQDAAEGVIEVNTVGILNNLITILKPLRFLRGLTIGDLTLRAKSGAARITMYNIQDPERVKDRIQKYWKEIAKKQTAKKALEDEEAQIRRMTVAVAQGFYWAQSAEFQKFWLNKDGTPEPPKTMPYKNLPAAEEKPTAQPAAEEKPAAEPTQPPGEEAKPATSAAPPAESPPPPQPPANGNGHPT